MSNIQLPPVVNNYIESGKVYATEHPMTAMTVLALAITCAIPVVVFLTFALITLLVTFTGFLFVEGMLKRFLNENSDTNIFFKLC